MKEILSTQNEFIKDLYKLKNNPNLVKEWGIVLIEGKNIINEQYAKKRIKYLLIDDPNKFVDMNDDVEKILVSRIIIEKLSSRKSNIGAIGVLEISRIKEPVINNDIVIVLDNVSNPNNLGAICRTACAFGVNKIYFIGPNVFHYNERVISASQGMVFDVSVEKITEKELEKFNCYIFDTSDTAKKITSITFKNPVALIFGNEARGISSSLKDSLTNSEVINIPIKKEVESLNLSTTVAIVIYYVSSK